MAHYTIVINTASGGGGSDDVHERVRRGFADAGVTAVLDVIRPGESVPATLRAAVAAKPDALVVGGGDGTVSTAAAALAGTGIPLGILPLGTLNHFARDAGIPLDLEEAIAVVIAGRARQVDVAEVNGKAFVNNSSIGVYPEIVRLRQHYQNRGRGKWLAMAWATLAVLRRRPFMPVRVVVDGETIVRRTPFVMVGNNEYRMEGLKAASRERLDAGTLSVYVMNASGRRNLLWLGLQVLLGRTQNLSELEMFTASEVVVETRRRSGQVARDGEVSAMAGPLTYCIRPRDLTLLSP